jgi:hypothetical protein
LSRPQDLESIWTSDDRAYDCYASILATDDRLLVATLEGEVMLLDANSDKARELSRWRLFPEEQAGYAHPALVGTRLYLRGNMSIICIELNP